MSFGLTVSQLARQAQLQWRAAGCRTVPGPVGVAVVNVGPCARVERLTLAAVTARHPAAGTPDMALLAVSPDEVSVPVDWESLCGELDYALDVLALPGATVVRVTAAPGPRDGRGEDVELVAVGDQPAAALVCTRRHANLEAPWPAVGRSPEAETGRTGDAVAGLLETGGQVPELSTARAGREAGLGAGGTSAAAQDEVLDLLDRAQAAWATIGGETSFRQALAELDALLEGLTRWAGSARPGRLLLPAARHVNRTAVSRQLSAVRVALVDRAAHPGPVREGLDLLAACLGDGPAQRFDRW